MSYLGMQSSTRTARTARARASSFPRRSCLARVPTPLRDFQALGARYEKGKIAGDTMRRVTIGIGIFEQELSFIFGATRSPLRESLVGHARDCYPGRARST